MQVNTYVEQRPSREGSLRGIEGIVVGTKDSKGRIRDLDLIVKPSRIYFRKDGAVTVRSYSTGKTVTVRNGFAFTVFSAWREDGNSTSVTLNHVQPDSVSV